MRDQPPASRHPWRLARFVVVAFVAVTLTVGAANTVTVGVASPLWVGSWKTTPSPDQAGSNDILTGAACVPGSTICVAVGHYQSSTDGLQTLVESWSGQHWWLTPSPDEGTNDNLLAVSCFSSSGCMAVGAYTNNSDISRTLIESWNGSSWSIIPSPNQAPGVNDLDNDILTALSCASASSCMAVGSIENGTVLTQPLIERWNGTRWSIIPSPSVGTQDSLSGVSCPSSVYCVAVGSYVDTSTGHDAPLIERWNGSLWSIGPSADSGISVLASVSCTSSINCMAVGTGYTQFGSLFESWNGSVWAIDPGSGGAGFPQSISCATSTSCVAVSLTDVDAWNGFAWSDTHVTVGDLEGVSCIATTNCVVVGVASDAGAYEDALVATWNGASLSVVPTSDVGAENNYLNAVSCVNSTECMAVGTYDNQDAGASASLIEAWNGSDWSIVPSPPLGILTSVSCGTARSCVAVGAGSASDDPLIEMWNGTVWSMVPSPRVAAVADVLSSVSCTSSVYCVAVGNYNDAPKNRYLALIETWNGIAWSVTPSPDEGTETNSLSSVSCVSATSCVAVGTYQNKSTQVFGALVDSWNGATWLVTPSPVVSAVRNSYLNGVSCSNATRCVAVGYTLASDQLVSEVWNGTQWSIVPVPTKGTNRSLVGVSCSTPASCVAIGSYRSASSVSRTLLETWNGASWSVTASPNQNTDADRLDGVSCTSSNACVAVGGGPDGTLIETGPG